jgi:uncharacterized short protein YbdD (DUF466 family)
MQSAQTMTAARMQNLRGLAVALRLKRLTTKLWQGIREWCGDNAYERYIQAQRTKPEKSCLLTPAEFYVERVNRRYSRPNRCC